MFLGGKFRLQSEHLACFNGGNFILGGQVLRRQDLIDFGLELVEGCYQTYHTTATQIGPEAFSWDDSLVPMNQREFYEKNGFFITNSGYNLRPEVIESYYYAHRATGDPKVRINPLAMLQPKSLGTLHSRQNSIKTGPGKLSLPSTQRLAQGVDLPPFVMSMHPMAVARRTTKSPSSLLKS